jgi:hypothetical protein
LFSFDVEGAAGARICAVTTAHVDTASERMAWLGGGLVPIVT